MDEPFELDLEDDEGLAGGLALWATGEDELGPALGRALSERAGRGPEAVARLARLALEVGLDFNSLYQAVLELVPPSPEEAALWIALAQVAPADAPLEVLYNLGLDLRIEVDAPDVALPLFRLALEQPPDDGETWFELGNTLDDLGQEEEALAAWARSGELDPAAAGPWLNRGQLLKSMGRFEEALPLIAEGLARGDEPEGWHVQGHVLQALGRQAEAEASLERAVKGYTDRIVAGQEVAEARFWRGAAQARLGRAEPALLDLGVALALEPSLRAAALEEEDFEALHALPGWTAALSAAVPGAPVLGVVGRGEEEDEA